MAPPHTAPAAARAASGPEGEATPGLPTMSPPLGTRVVPVLATEKRDVAAAASCRLDVARTTLLASSSGPSRLVFTP